VFSFRSKPLLYAGAFFVLLNQKFMKHTISNTGFLTDAKGNKSSTRLKTFLATITALIIALICVLSKEITSGECLPVIITLLMYAAGEKSFQLYWESKASQP
jgi:hypothetical protein